MDLIKLGEICVSPLWMAPMAGVTDKPYRLLLGEQGCGLAFTEMISGKAIQFNNRRTWNMLDLEGEHPIGVQLFGSEPGVMADAAKVAQEQGADIIDINMGCPVPKIVGNNEGAALMKDPELAANIVGAVVQAVSVPVTVKFRAGWDKDSVTAVPFAQRVVAAGAKAITVHGRTRQQMYSGKADWNLIAQVVKAVDVPVIGNGDVWTGQDALRLMETTNCAGIMVARGAMGNPWLFTDIMMALKGQKFSHPTPEDKVNMAIRHLEMEVEYRGLPMGVVFMRKHLSWYLKGLPGTATVKQEIFQQTDPQVIKELLLSFAKKVSIAAQ